ncbi:transposase family protein [Streptococcus pneumoniae]|nr:transposase family protein [Streptococcus pneumoniae]
MDNAIWHKSSILKIPTNIGFTFIPPYTPEMNPIEQVWKEIRKRGFKNKTFRTLEDVMNQLQDVWTLLLRPITNDLMARSARLLERTRCPSFKMVLKVSSYLRLYSIALPSFEPAKTD